MNITSTQALSAYRNIIGAFVDNQDLPVNDVNLLVASIKDLQVRDYVLGHAPDFLTPAGAVALMTAILPLVEEHERTPFYTLMSAFYYELGDKDLAYASLITGQALDPKYSLAHLLNRVFEAGWPSEALTQMRAELHPKVEASFAEERELFV